MLTVYCRLPKAGTWMWELWCFAHQWLAVVTHPCDNSQLVSTGRVTPLLSQSHLNKTNIPIARPISVTYSYRKHNKSRMFSETRQQKLANQHQIFNPFFHTEMLLISAYISRMKCSELSKLFIHSRIFQIHESQTDILIGEVVGFFSKTTNFM